jgi:transcriptional regulator with PAS, ATPase and Fis domain
MIGNSPALHLLKMHLYNAGRHTASVLLQGETGTGKELAAHAIHDYSNRPGRFLALDCGALPDDLAESELFGYERGAFTNANGSKEGLIEAAQDGTLFLDELGNTSLRLQAKLLRVLQERTIRRLGSNKDRPLDVRIIAATNTDLAQQVQSGQFRADLRYRFAVTITVSSFNR